MKKMIILEGADLSGKSTLAALLSKLTDIPLLENRSYKFNTEEEHHKLIDLKAHIEYNCILANRHLISNVIVDRFIISNIVYPNFYKRNYDYSYMKKEDWNDVDVKLIFVTLEDEKIIEERLKKRGDFLDLNLQKIVGLRKEYEKAFEIFGMPYLKVDGSQPLSKSIEKISEHIKIYIDQRMISRCLEKTKI